MNAETNEEVSAEDSAIDELFDGESEEGESEEVAEKSETEATEEAETTAGDDKATREDTASAQDDESAASEEESESADEEPTSVPIAALHDERRKREALTKENEKLKSQLPQDESEVPDMYDDPEGYKQWVKNQVTADLIKERIETSRTQMLEVHEDYEAMEKTFMFLAEQDNSLATKMNNHPEPAKFAYNTAKAHRDSERKKLKDEVRAELLTEKGKGEEAEATEKELTDEQKRNKSAVDTPNLTSAAATDKNTVQVEKDEGLDDMFGDQKY